MPQKINIDIQRSILELLPVEDRVRFERVNSQWQQMSNKAFQVQKILPPLPAQRPSWYLYIKLVSRCPNLRIYDFKYSKYHVCNSLYKWCPKITSFINVTQASLETVKDYLMSLKEDGENLSSSRSGDQMRSCDQITRIDMDTRSFSSMYPVENVLSELFQSFDLRIRQVSRTLIIGDHLSNIFFLSEVLEHVESIKIDLEPESNYENLFSDNSVDIVLDEITGGIPIIDDNLDNQALESICEKFSKLTKLEIPLYQIYFDCLSRCDKLITFSELSYDGPKIERPDIRSKKITNMNNLLKMKNLKHLKLTSLAEYSNQECLVDYLSQFGSNLKSLELYVSGDPLSIITAIKFCFNLKVLKLEIVREWNRELEDVLGHSLSYVRKLKILKVKGLKNLSKFQEHCPRLILIR